MSTYNEEDLANLTQEERDALNEDDGAGSNLTLGESLNDDGTLKADEGKADEGKAAEADDGKGKTATAAGADNAGKQADADEATKTPVAEVAPAKPMPMLVAEAPADADTKLKEIGDKKGSLLDQFDNGDITAKEYQSQLDALNKDERAIERAVEKAQTAKELNQQQEVNTWLSQVNDFTTKDYPEYRTSKSRWMALDSFVKEIAADPKNANLPGSEILKKAHAMVESDLGAAPATAGKGAETPKLTDKAGKPLKGAKIDPPQTLAKVPAADHSTTGEDGRWAALDRLGETDPEGLEDQLMKMSASDRDAYLASR